MRQMRCGAFHLPSLPIAVFSFQFSALQFCSFSVFQFCCTHFQPLFHFTYIFRSEFFSSSSLGSFFCRCVSHERRKKSGQRQTTAEMTENAKQLSARGKQGRGGRGGTAVLFIAPNGRWLCLGHSHVAVVAVANVATLKSV